MTTIDTISEIAPRHYAGASGGAGFARRFSAAAHYLIASIIFRLERRQSRLALLEMTDDQLKDIGISRADAYREGMRPVWA